MYGNIWKLEERDDYSPHCKKTLLSIKTIPNSYQKQNKGENYDLERM